MKIIQIQAMGGEDGDLYGLDEQGGLYVYRSAMRPHMRRNGQPEDGWTAGWAPMDCGISELVPHPGKEQS